MILSNLGGDYILAFVPVSPCSGTGCVYEELSLQVEVEKAGYIYIYVSNESEKVSEVFFDDFEITHHQSPVVFEHDYYPFGLPMAGRQITDEEYRFDYQGQFAEKDSITGFNSFALRQYDARFGRWMSTDPYGQYASPYVGMGDMAHMGVDPDGGWNWKTAAIGAAVGAGVGYVASDGDWRYALVGGIAGGISGGASSSKSTTANQSRVPRYNPSGISSTGNSPVFSINPEGLTASLNGLVGLGRAAYATAQNEGPIDVNTANPQEVINQLHFAILDARDNHDGILELRRYFAGTLEKSVSDYWPDGIPNYLVGVAFMNIDIQTFKVNIRDDLHFANWRQMNSDGSVIDYYNAVYFGPNYNQSIQLIDRGHRWPGSNSNLGKRDSWHSLFANFYGLKK